MILASHAIIGGALGRIVPSPFAAFALGFLSHYATDAIPHWEYHLPTISGMNIMPGAEKKSKRRLPDILFAVLDLALGILFAVMLFGEDSGGASLAAGIIGGVLPDGIQFLYSYFKIKPLALHQKFHDWIHAPNGLYDKPVLGILLQLALVGLFVAISKIAAGI